MSTIHQRIPTRISPDILDTIGKSFKFSHGKGVAEWLKNSLDNYLRLTEYGEESRSGMWPVLLNLVDGARTKPGPNLAVIDFGGASFDDVQQFFLYWGDRSAATHGRRSNASVTGGHGNGGKFYMREMWRHGSRFLTWRNHKVTSLIVDRSDDGTTGMWELQDQTMDWRDSLRFALSDEENLGGNDWIISYLQKHEPSILEELDACRRGLSVVVGRRAEQLYSSNDVVSGARWNYQRLVDDIREAPQARRPIRELSISVFVNGELRLPHLHSHSFDDDPDWPPQEWILPSHIVEGETDPVTDASIGSFQLRKSATQLSGRMKEFNCIFITDEAGNPVASYPMGEVPISGYSALLSFLSGNLQLTFPKLDSLVQNDRERLISTQTTYRILAWVGERVLERAREIEGAQREMERKNELELATVLNQALNDHAKRFLREVQTEILVDLIRDTNGTEPSSEGGEGVGWEGQGGIGERGDGPDGKGPDGKGGTNPGDLDEIPGTSHQSRVPRFPQVLLSGIDPDPSKDDGASKQFTDRHPPLEQDDIDRQHNVWWINTLHPFAQEALRHGGAQGSTFKAFQLYMFCEVVQYETLRLIQLREAELSLDRVENDLAEVSNMFLAELPRDLVEELFG
jgi:hypothetical protein